MRSDSHAYGINDGAVRVMDRIIFSLYVFCYLWLYQSDLERYVHNAITGGAIVFHPLWIALLFSLLVILVEIPFSMLMKFKGAWEACNYVPSMLLVAASTSYNEHCFVGYSMGGWILILIVSLVLILLLRLMAELNGPARKNRLFAHAINLMLISAIIMIPPLIGNSDECFHRELRAGRYFDSGQYEKLLSVGRNADETTPGLEILRAEAMARMSADKSFAGSELGNRLFQYPQRYPYSTAEALVRDTVANGAEHENRILSAMLLRRSLDTFAAELYEPGDSAVLSANAWHGDLPVYYMQALVLYDYLKGNSSSPALDRYRGQLSEQKKLLADYMTQKSEISNLPRRSQANLLSKQYRDTYFWYYDFQVLRSSE